MDELTRRFVENAPSIAAVIATALIFTELVRLLRRQPQAEPTPRPISKFIGTNWIFFSGVAVTSIVFFIVIFSQWEPKDILTIWSNKITKELEGCVADNIGEASTEDLEKKLRFNCLSLAIKAEPVPAVPVRFHSERTMPGGAFDKANVDAIIRYQRAGEVLMNNPAVSELLAQNYGIYSNFFLGSGFTYPHRDSERTSTFANFRAGIREYFVRNYCIGQHPRCKNEDPKRNWDRAWGWQLDYQQGDLLNPKATIGQIISRHKPTLNYQPDIKNTWPQYLRQILDNIGSDIPQNERILVRFAQFPESDYSGTLGHPTRDYVFFTDARDVWNMTYQEAQAASGRIPVENVGSGVKVFMWVIALDPATSTHFGLASWDYIFHLLGSRTVDARNPI